jgi:alkylhydroperoxidase/carboxymuconolactone decarboxylase family protein YurZ
MEYSSVRLGKPPHLMGVNGLSQDDFDGRFDQLELAPQMAKQFPGMHEAAKNLWNTAFGDPSISIRMKELLLLALFASPAGYNQPIVNQQVERALGAGASKMDVADVLISVAGLSNHALYEALPLAEEYFSKDEIAEGINQDAVVAVDRAKQEFIRVRGFWNPGRDIIGRTIPDYLLTASEFSTAATKHGTLTATEREMVFIAIDASVNHMSELGLRIHYANARKVGMTFRQVAAVLKIVGVVGLLAYINSAPRLVER